MKETLSMLRFCEDIYLQHLNPLNKINFLPREIDILASLLEFKSTKKIASFLSLSPRTIDNCIYNLTKKLELKNRQEIIDLIKKTNYLTYLKEYFLSLKIQLFFEKTLKDFSKKNSCNKLILFRVEENFTKNQKHLDLVKKHMSLCGAKVFFDKETACITDIHVIQHINIDFSTPLVYYNSFFKFLENIFSEEFVINNLLPVEESFQFELKKNFSKEQIEHKESPKISLFLDIVGLQIKYLFKNKKNILFPLLGLLLLLFLYFLNHSIKKNTLNLASVRNDIIIPHLSTLLERPAFIKQIDEKLKAKTGIQVVAIVGIGGAGKTTLARQYASTQDLSIVWEINAETQNSLANSFENLAYSLAETADAKHELELIQKIDHMQNRTEKLLLFVKKALRKKKQWLLIYDNVEKLADIKRVFPYDYSVWGEGKVIITTRDANIHTNRHLSDDNIMYVKDLTDNEKINLFCKILNYDKVNGYANQDMGDLLKEIPSLPLDIATAAYYIKDTKISLKEYIDYLKNSVLEFEKAQENMFMEGGDYIKTRYSIVVQTLKKVLSEDEQFKDLFLTISLIDSQDIPRSLLETCKDKWVVHSFIKVLKRYSLITSESVLPNKQKSKTFSIHRDTQAISLNFLKRELNLKDSHSSVEKIGRYFKTYMSTVKDEFDTNQMTLLGKHAETFLKHQEIISLPLSAEVSHELGNLYKLMGKYTEAFNYLHNAANIHKEKNDKLVEALVLADIGYTHCIIGEYKKAIKVLNLCISEIRKHYGADHVKFAKVLTELATANKYAGHYENSVTLYKQSAEIYRKNDKEPDFIKASTYLGDVYRYLGKYKESQRLLEAALKYYKDKNDELGYAWVSRLAGGLYNYLGNYERAQELLEDSLKNYVSWYGEKHIKLLEILSHLSKTYLGLKKYEESKKCFEKYQEIFGNTTFEVNHHPTPNAYAYLNDEDKAITTLNSELQFCIEYYGPSHIASAIVMMDLGYCYIIQGNYETAEKYLKEVQKLLEYKNHPQLYEVLEYLADLKSKQINSPLIQAVELYEKAIDALHQDFPLKDSHIARIKKKIENLLERNF